MRLTVSTTVERPREDVHALVSDLPVHRRSAKGGGGRGEARVVESSPDCAVEEILSGKRVIRGTYELRTLGEDRTEVRFTNETVARANPLEALFDPLAKAYLKRNNQRALDRLKALMETR